MSKEQAKRSGSTVQCPKDRRSAAHRSHEAGTPGRDKATDLYHIDRMMVHLKRCGGLEHLAGLVVGQLSGMHDNAVPFGKGAYEIIAEQVAGYEYPLAFGLPIGHEPLNLAVPVATQLVLESDAARLVQPISTT